MAQIDSILTDSGMEVVITNPKILIFFNSKCQLLNCDQVDSLRDRLDKELQRLKDLFASYKYDFDDGDVYEDKERGELVKTLEDIRKTDNLRENDSLIVCLLGLAGENNLMCLKDDKITLDDVIRPFKGDQCFALVGKPKLFFIQLYDKIKEERKAQSLVEEKKLPVDADLFIGYTKIPFDWQGPTMISELLKCPKMDLDMCDMFTAVNRAISDHNHQVGNSAFSCFMSMLTSFVKLSP